MSNRRPFRFGVQEHGAPGPKEWRDNARRVESLGYAALYLPDHLDDQLAPIAALMSVADATSTLRVGALVFDNDYRHPVVLAKEAATLDLLSDGRLDFGLGAGWLAADYEKAGIPYDSAGTRIERMEEGLKIIKGLLLGGNYSFSGKHYRITDMEGFPLPAQRPHPPIIIGGGGQRMLSLAAREADIISVNYNLAEGRVSSAAVRSGMAEATDEKLGWIKDAAGARIDHIELSVLISFANITDDRDSIAAALAPGMGAEPRDILDIPHFLIGTIDQLVEQLQERRERYGISYVIVPSEALEEFAPVVQRLVGT